MQKFIHYEDLSDWDEDDVVVVEIVDSETAYVRTHHEQTIRGPLPVKEAISDAKRFMSNVPGIRGIGAYLPEGVKWSSSWGELIRAP